jgi:hypothetical protein
MKVTHSAWIVAMLAACTSSPEPPSSSTSSAAPSASAAKTGEAEAEVRALFQRWLGAQNAGDFRAYETLYADKFEGVKRAGTRTRRFPRAGWLEDRKAMFAKKMVVEASDVTILASHASARVRFEQKFSSGTFEDRGTKEIVAVKSKSGWKIAREEMLQSTIGKSNLGALDGERFAFVVHAKAPRVVLAPEPDAAWIQGAPRLVDDKNPVITESSVAEARLPKELAAWHKRSLRLFGNAGEVCRAVVSGFSIVARVEPHFGTRAFWRGRPDEAGIDEPPGPPLSREKVAAEAFGMAEGGKVLVANLKIESGKCDGASWARSADLDVPKIAKAEPVLIDLERRALAEFRKLPAYVALASDFSKESPSNVGPWEEHGGAHPVVRQFRIDGGPTLVAVDADVAGGCAEFAGSLLALFELQGDKLALANEPTEGWMPSSAVDVDGDKKVEFIGNEAILRASGASWTREEHLSIPFLDCGC